jgi:hypothetical protein
MKRFIFSVFAVTVFFVGLGTLVERAGAGSKSDEKALAIIRGARAAVGGDAAIGAVRSLLIAGSVTHTVKIDGVERTVEGESEIALQLPDKVMRKVAIKHGEGLPGDKMVHKQVDVVVVGAKGKGEGSGVGTGAGEKHVIIKKDDGTVREYRGAEAENVIAEDQANGGDVKTVILKKAEGDRSAVDAEVEKARAAGHDVMFKRVGGPDHAAMKQNELLRLTLGLLLTPPQGMDVSYAFGGETYVDGTACNIVVAEFAGSAYQLYIGRSSNLPVMMTYKGMPHVIAFRTKGPEVAKDKAVFTRKVEGPPPEMIDIAVKFSDYRSTGGLQLPYRWVQTGGMGNETFTVASYDVNPANIVDKFNNKNVNIKIEKADEN